MPRKPCTPRRRRPSLPALALLGALAGAALGGVLARSPAHLVCVDVTPSVELALPWALGVLVTLVLASAR
ncbi:MAG: hypothetical protein H6713_15350 [Myxococcales bacterium]|nr:hypothetical protein [Myxococcales bacterium]